MSADQGRYESSIPYFKSYMKPYLDGGAALRSALSSPGELVLIKAHVLDTHDVDCVLLASNRRVIVTRVGSLMKTLIGKAAMNILGKPPAGVGDILQALAELGKSAVDAATEKDLQLAQQIASVDDAALLASPPGGHLLCVDYRTLARDYEKVELMRMGGAIFPRLLFSTRSWWGLVSGASPFKLPPGHLEIYRAHFDLVKDYLAQRFAVLCTSDDFFVDLKLPAQP
jgi:hypothetical protein